MASVSSIYSLFTAHEAEMTAQIDGIERAVTQIGNKLVNALIDLEGQQGWQSQLLVKQITWLQVQLRGQLNVLGWQDLANKFVSLYDTSEIFGKTILEAIGRPDVMLTPMRQDTIRNLRDMDLSAFNEYGNRLVGTLAKELTLNTLVGKKRSAMIKSMTEAMDGQTKQATLFVDTATRAFDRTVNWQLWEEAGIEYFRYFGPSDNATRPFCQAHVGKVYSLAEIKKMSNGSTQFGNVMTYGGGPRCRHSWTPVPDYHPPENKE